MTGHINDIASHCHEKQTAFTIDQLTGSKCASGIRHEMSQSSANIEPQTNYQFDDESHRLLKDYGERIFPPNETERLRRFLSFCLAIDYNLTSKTPDKLTQGDFSHFVPLSHRCFLSPSEEEEEPFIRPLSMKWSEPRDITTLDTFITEQLLNPAKALGVPSSVAISMLRLFLVAIPFWSSGYSSRIPWLAKTTSLKTLAAKFVMDREVLLPALIPLFEEEFLEQMSDRMRAEHSRWFDRVSSPMDFEVGNAIEGCVCATLERRDREVPHLGRLRYRDNEGAIRRDCEYAMLVVESFEMAGREESWKIWALRRWFRVRGVVLFER